MSKIEGWDTVSNDNERILEGGINRVKLKVVCKKCKSSAWLHAVTIIWRCGRRYRHKTIWCRECGHRFSFYVEPLRDNRKG